MLFYKQQEKKLETMEKQEQINSHRQPQNAEANFLRDGNFQLPKETGIRSQWKGSIPFQKSLELQEALKSPAKSSPGFFLGFESRQGVITKGLRTEEADILWSDKQLKEKQISIIPLKRGGKATLHAPGQLVIYPVIHLASFKWQIKDFIVLLESITREFLLDLGIVSERKEKYSGLSTSKGKVAFFGIHVSEGVSQHGLSINVSNDLNLFHSIKSCGVENRPHDRLIDHKIPFTIKELFEKWTDRAKPVFNEHYHKWKNPTPFRKTESEQPSPR